MFDESLVKTANALVAHCRNGTEAEGLDTLYSPDAVSVEAAEMEGSMGRTVEGLEGIRAKHAWWDSNTEVHAFNADGPYLHGDDRFGVIFEADVTMTNAGQRMSMKELAIYTVDGGKIVREEFYFTM